MTDQTSTGEPTIHPQFCEFLETVYNSGVVPNYTTNGITLAKGDEYTDKLLDSTKKYVGPMSYHKVGASWTETKYQSLKISRTWAFKVVIV